MRIFTHWKDDGHIHTKHFFSTKAEEETAVKKAKAEGKNVVARHDWTIEPNAKAVATFCNEQMHLREYSDLGEYF